MPRQLKTKPPAQRGWVLYDGDCSFCLGWVKQARPILEPKGFTFLPLQTPWVKERLGLHPGDDLAEMRVLTEKGHVIGGGDAMIHLSKFIWWARPFWLLASIPFFKPMVRWGYRWVAQRRYCFGGSCRTDPS